MESFQQMHPLLAGPLYLLILIPFYLIGCFPTGMILARIAGVDITKQGSGNVGATNVARVLGAKAGVVTLVLDLLKGALAVLIAQALFGLSHLTNLAGLAAVLGHCISLPPRLKGGKGVATSLGVLLALSPELAAWPLGIFLLIFSVSKIVSLSSLVALIATPLIAAFLDFSTSVLIVLGLIALVVTLRHQANINRLIRGEEPRFSRKKSSN